MKALARLKYLLVLEVSVLTLSTTWVLFHVCRTFNQEIAVCVTVSIVSQYLGLLLKTFLAAPSANAYYCRTAADPGYMVSILVPLAVIGDLVYITRHNVFIDTLHWFDEFHKSLDDFIDTEHLDQKLKAKVHYEYVYSVLGCCLLTSCFSTWSLLVNKNRKKPMRWPDILMDVSLALAILSASVLVVKAGPLGVVLMLVLCVVVFCSIYNLPRQLTRVFSLGELSCVVQLCAVVTWRVVYVLKTKDITNFSLYNIESVQTIVYAAVAMIIVTYLTLPKLTKRDKPWLFYGIFLVYSAMYVIPASLYILKQDLVTWMLYNMVKWSRRMYLLLYWMICSAVAAGLCSCQQVSHDAFQSQTVIRKYFHIVIVIVYIPGLLVDADFLHLASVFAGAFLLLLEAIRVFSIPPFGRLIDGSFHMFVDEKDEGYVVLTHIYLLVGLSLPLWITNIRPVDGFLFQAYSGVISLGVGDTAASLGGSLLGRHKWPGSKKSMEGTVLCFTSQLVVLITLSLSGAVTSPLRLSLVVPILLSSLYEAFTLQIDNLVLPLLTYALLCVS